MESPKKRKQGPSREDRWSKRPKNGGGNRSQGDRKVDAVPLERGYIEAGNAGIWVTCARGQEIKAAREITALFDDYVERLYSVKPPGDAESEEEEEGDIDDLITREIASMKAEVKKPSRAFTILRVGLECVLFVRTKAPLEPVSFCKAVCQGVKKSAEEPRSWRSRYVNRLVPVSHVIRASMEGLEELGRIVLPASFKMNPRKSNSGDEAGESVADEDAVEEQDDNHDDDKPSSTYAIRPSFRNHNTLSRGDIIPAVARLISKDKHSVKLSKPDKVILIDVYAAFIGMSVVDGDWDPELKRYNLAELFQAATFKGEKGGYPSKTANRTALKSDEKTQQGPEPSTIQEKQDTQATTGQENEATQATTGDTTQVTTAPQDGDAAQAVTEEITTATTGQEGEATPAFV